MGEAIAKYRSRAELVAQSGASAANAARLYNQRCVPVLGYLPSFCAPPRDLFRQESAAVHSNQLLLGGAFLWMARNRGSETHLGILPDPGVRGSDGFSGQEFLARAKARAGGSRRARRLAGLGARSLQPGFLEPATLLRVPSRDGGDAGEQAVARPPSASPHAWGAGEARTAGEASGAASTGLLLRFRARDAAPGSPHGQDPFGGPSFRRKGCGLEADGGLRRRTPE